MSSYRAPFVFYLHFSREDAALLRAQGVDLSGMRSAFFVTDSKILPLNDGEAIADGNATSEEINFVIDCPLYWSHALKQFLAAIPHRWYDNVQWHGRKVCLAVIMSAES